jgi:hypothetical protein
VVSDFAETGERQCTLSGPALGRLNSRIIRVGSRSTSTRLTCITVDGRNRDWYYEVVLWLWVFLQTTRVKRRAKQIYLWIQDLIGWC